MDRRRWLVFPAVLTAAILLPLSMSVRAQASNVRCNADLVCVHVLKNDDEIRLVLESHTRKPLSFGLFFSSNLSHLNPPIRTIEARGPTTLTVVPDPGEPWGFDFRIHYGHESHPHNDKHVYLLPFAPGTAFEVTQSHTRLTTHRLGNRYALDWKMPIGEPVHAARGGVVVSTFDGSHTKSLTGTATANHIWIRHADGTIGKYLHLDPGGVLVDEGQTVAAGDRIGSAGETGFTNGPHLHFSVSTLGGRALYQTFDVLFATVDGPRRLVTGDRYTRVQDGEPSMSP